MSDKHPALGTSTEHPTPSTGHLRLLHLCDTLFPLGGFAYSDGLESATANGAIADADALGGWLDVCLDEAIARLDGPVACEAWQLVREECWTALAALPAMRGLATDYGGHLHRRKPARSAVAEDHGQRKAPGSRRYCWDNTLLPTHPSSAPSVPCVPAQS